MELTLNQRKIVELEVELEDLRTTLFSLTYHPKYTGIIVVKRIRCGKAGCRCQSGELHGPYVYRQYRDENGKQHQEYISKKKAPRIAKLVRESQAYSRTERMIKKKERELQRLRKECAQDG